MFHKAFAYKSPDSPKVRLQQILLINFLTITTLFSFLYVTVSFFIDFFPGIVAMITCSLLFLVTLYLFLHHKISYETGANLYISNSCIVAIANCSFYSGGDISPVLPWFILIPVISLLLFGKARATYAWFFFSLAATVGAYVAGILGYGFPIYYDYDLAKPFGLICSGGLISIIFIITMVFEATKANALKEIDRKNREILDSITYAKRIQTAILPPRKMLEKYLPNSFILYKPKDIVAGDFYWLEPVDNQVMFAAADCTGHGVPGAMVSVICNYSLNRSVREFNLRLPGEILDKTKELVVKEFEASEDDVKDGMDIALCSIDGLKLKYAGAHLPLWIVRNGKILETKPSKQPVGKFETSAPYITHEIDLQKGDGIYIFSDGIVDQFGGPKEKKFKANALRELLLSNQEASMCEQKEIIDASFEAWKGDLDQVDDVCVIGVRV